MYLLNNVYFNSLLPFIDKKVTNINKMNKKSDEKTLSGRTGKHIDTSMENPYNEIEEKKG